MSELGRLHPDDITLIADAVAERMRAEVPSAGRLLTVAEVAKRVGMGTEWVREHAERLGGRKLSEGRNAPWRFDPGTLSDFFVAQRKETRRLTKAVLPRRSRHTANGAPLLPIGPAGERPTGCTEQV